MARSKLWYILPIFFGIAGGIGAWIMLRVGFLVKKDNTDFPFKLLVLGLIVSGITWTIQVVWFGLEQRMAQSLPDIIIDTTVPLYSFLT